MGRRLTSSRTVRTVVMSMAAGSLRRKVALGRLPPLRGSWTLSPEICKGGGKGLPACLSANNDLCLLPTSDLRPQTAKQCD